MMPRRCKTAPNNSCQVDEASQLFKLDNATIPRVTGDPQAFSAISTRVEVKANVLTR